MTHNVRRDTGKESVATTKAANMAAPTTVVVMALPAKSRKFFSLHARWQET
jgi:hypothetical protein